MNKTLAAACLMLSSLPLSAAPSAHEALRAASADAFAGLAHFAPAAAPATVAPVEVKAAKTAAASEPRIVPLKGVARLAGQVLAGQNSPTASGFLFGDAKVSDESGKITGTLKKIQVSITCTSFGAAPVPIPIPTPAPRSYQCNGVVKLTFPLYENGAYLGDAAVSGNFFARAYGNGALSVSDKVALTGTVTLPTP